MSLLDLPLKLLVVADDLPLRNPVVHTLEAAGYVCRCAGSLGQAQKALAEDTFQVVVLDLATDSHSGLRVLEFIRRDDETTSVVILTSLDSRTELRAGLEAGADDFLLKPFSMNELRARVDAALIRARKRPQTSLEVGHLSMNLSSRRVDHDGRQVSLTPTEFRILELLMRNHDEVVTRRMLCETLWDPEWEGVTNVIEVHINRLRTKLRNGSDAQLIHTVRGRGYILRSQGENRGETVENNGTGGRTLNRIG